MTVPIEPLEPDKVLRAAVSRIDISNNEFARHLSLNERDFRRMFAGRTEIPPDVLAYALKLARFVERHRPAPDYTPKRLRGASHDTAGEAVIVVDYRRAQR